MTEDGMKIDRLSQLPSELLYDIFALAASSHELCTVPPSRYLLPFHETALFRHLKFSQDFESGFIQYCNTMEKKTDMALKARVFSWNIFWSSSWIDYAAHWEALHSKLTNIEEIEFGSSVFQFPYTFFESTSPHTLRLATPHLRLKAFDWFDRILHFHLTCTSGWENERLEEILTQLPTTLQTLRLEFIDDRQNPDEPLPLEPVYNHIPRFPDLRHLHLDSIFHRGNLRDSLSQLSHLSTLSLTIDHFDPEFRRLFETPRRPPILRTLILTYTPINSEETFDPEFLQAMKESLQEEALSEVEHHRMMRNRIDILKECHSCWNMFCWRVPFQDDFLQGLEEAGEVEGAALRAGIAVKSNLDTLRPALQRQLIEYWNRGIGLLYLFDDASIIEDAYSVSSEYGMNLPPLYVDPDQDLGRDEVEWFYHSRGNGSSSVEDGYNELSLRYKEEIAGV